MLIKILAMIEAPYPANETERRKELKSFHILDTPPEEAYDNIVRAAANICDVPIALISFIDDDRQWFKSKVGTTVTGSKRSVSFCSHAILNPSATTVVNDTLKDERFHDNPLVAGEPNIRFYAGAPLVSKNGNALGILCVIDTEPRELTGEQTMVLRLMAKWVVDLLEIRKASIETHKFRNSLAMVEDVANIGRWHADLSDDSIHWSDKMFEINNLDKESYRPCKEFFAGLYHPEDKARIGKMFRLLLTKQQPFSTDARLMRLDGKVVNVKIAGDCYVDSAGNLRSAFGILAKI